MNKIIVHQKEIRKIFDEFVERNEIKINREKAFEEFLKFLEIDVYDWIKENLRCYFSEDR